MHKLESSPMKACLIYATFGRPDILSKAFDAVTRQTVAPVSIIVSCSRVEDAGRLGNMENVKILIGPKGLPLQRNRALEAIPDSADVVIFFDDDFVPHPQWIEKILSIFEACPNVGAATGNLLADGIKGPGISPEKAFEYLNLAAHLPPWILEAYSPYGCNMAFRRSMISGLKFDEQLVLYGWLEDRDFAASMAHRGGRMVKVGAALGVHMGVKSGRTSGLQLGYSQVVNPIYLYLKGNMPATLVVQHIFGNVVSNIVLAAKPEPYVDRIGRLRGNLVGFLDVLRGRVTPERAAKL